MITGGTTGIGLEAARQFLSNGAKVIVTGRNQEKLDEVKKLYPALVTIKSDVANADDARSLFDQVKTLGGIDILYNNAGIMSGPSNLGLANAKHFELAKNEMDVNYLGIVNLNNTFIEMLKARKEAAIINTTSTVSYVPLNLAPTYSASKAALRFYTTALRDHLEILGSNVKVFELAPPVVDTNMSANLDRKGITPEKLVNALIVGIRKDQSTIHVGDTRFVYVLHRLFPALTYRLVNPAQNRHKLNT